jgi:hypothetical protein
MDEVLCLWKNKFVEEEEGGVFICERAGEAELLRIRHFLPDSISREFRVRLCGLSLRFVAVEAAAKPSWL